MLAPTQSPLPYSCPHAFTPAIQRPLYLQLRARPLASNNARTRYVSDSRPARPSRQAHPYLASVQGRSAWEDEENGDWISSYITLGNHCGCRSTPQEGTSPSPRSNRARAQERLDLRKVRQSTSHGGAPAYKIRGEGHGIEFQYLCSDGNVSAGSTVESCHGLTLAPDPKDRYRVPETGRVRESTADTPEPGAFCDN